MAEASISPPWLVLLGPPGSGKSFLGSRLASRFGWVWTDYEPLLLGRYGSREAFVRNKEEALRWVEEDLRARRRTTGKTVVVESTGLSDRPMLERFLAEGRALFVHLRVPREVCLRRVAGRPKGGHFDDDPASASRFHDFWSRDVAPTWPCDLALDDAAAGDADAGPGPSTEVAIARIGALLVRAASPGRDGG